MTATDSIPLDAFYDLTRITELAISPTGDRVAFVATEYDEAAEEAVTSLFVVPADGSREPHRLTTVDGASSPAWSPSGDRLAFLAARETDVERRVGRSERADSDDDADGENGSDEEPKQQVWAFDLERGGDARQVTDREEGVSAFDWSPEGDRLVIASRDPTEDEQSYLEQVRDGGPIETTRLQHKVDGVGWTDEVTTYLFVVDYESGDLDRLDDAYGGGAFQDLAGVEPRWGPTDRIAFTSCRLERPDDTLIRDVYTIAPDGAGLERLTDGDVQCSGPSWREDGTLGFLARDPENWCRPTEVYYYDGEEARSLTVDLDRTVAFWGTVEWVGDAAYTLVGDEGRTRIVRADLDGTVERVFEAQGDDRAIMGFDVADDEQTASLLFSHPNDGLDVHTVATEDLTADEPPASLRRLSDVNADLIDSYSMPTVRRVEWESNGWTLDGVVYHDPDVDLEDGPHPLVVAIHGGPMSYDEPEFSFDHAALTSRDYVVFRPNYRGGTSRGREFAEVLKGRWGTAEVEDIAAGVEDLVDRGWVDSDRVFGHGFSYGGIAQGYLVTQTDLFTAAAPEHGIYDLRSEFGTSDSHNWTEADFGLPWENPETYDDASAILKADELSTPLLVMAGGEDWRCPPTQSEQFYVAARKQDVDAKLVVYPDENHDVGDPDRAIHRLEQLLEWYEKHDPGREESAADE
ncbi:S9 family peptidase [Natronobacterium gregoryi]|uniref:Dipeptidyl aminopeptidase/acylaminoacyl peptidase n=2 Tax=Natronobacterium gregoryi TaxID=44930 RepID=L0AGH0_NATGS|nr:S9 family peptidase [Natronobacterium gregoryi]AFZ72252.1 dipeptidyl aminopeptidase/acylaminoacyl peptidase [Natronobacterium gregoryi SP2]ELY62348.1 dipeptidyl aminopeptidase/acylaminoacyl peptidase [Natronobacterium gregoryi SP2]PLK20199.1 S9 family peptidase [Natronobacterium gregoryi SP2]SFJ28962.1 Dipeptidyl aminopeptidase/acylaminoacyl peptidase [Natronobacterium gregoryi]